MSFQVANSNLINFSLNDTAKTGRNQNQNTRYLLSLWIFGSMFSVQSQTLAPLVSDSARDVHAQGVCRNLYSYLQL